MINTYMLISFHNSYIMSLINWPRMYNHRLKSIFSTTNFLGAYTNLKEKYSLIFNSISVSTGSFIFFFIDENRFNYKTRMFGANVILSRLLKFLDLVLQCEQVQAESISSSWKYLFKHSLTVSLRWMKFFSTNGKLRS